MTPLAAPAPMARRAVAVVFLAFAFAYFLSALLRAVTATLAPVFSRELGLHAGELGLLGGAYFLGFAAMQLPLGRALDRFGPKRVLLSLLGVALLGCAGFALATGLPMLVLARMSTGVGVAACLMAPLTCFRRLMSPPAQLRANAWMLMTGSLGMVASTLPVQRLLEAWGWRGLFWLIALMLGAAMAGIAAAVPADAPPAASRTMVPMGYRQIFGHPMFRRLAPMAFFQYGGLIAIQSLWAGPWLTRVSGWPESTAAAGLFLINVCMLVTFMGWGALMPRLAAHGLGALRLAAWGVPLSLLALAANLLAGPSAGAVHWALWCIASTAVTPSQPALANAFPASAAGRALSAYNLVIFSGVFALQWGIGLMVDGLLDLGWSELAAFRCAFGAFLGCCMLAYAWFMLAPHRPVDNGPQSEKTWLPS